AGKGVTFVVHYDSPVALQRPVFGIFIQGMNGEPLIHLQTLSQLPTIPALPPRGVVRCHVPSLPLMPGSYPVCFNCALLYTPGHLDYLDRALTLEVERADYFGTGQLPPRRFATFLVKGCWNIETEEGANPFAQDDAQALVEERSAVAGDSPADPVNGRIPGGSPPVPC